MERLRERSLSFYKYLLKTCAPCRCFVTLQLKYFGQFCPVQKILQATTKPMYDIEAIFDSLLRQFDIIDMADSEFGRMCVDDPELRKAYKDWCEEQGFPQRTGFLIYASEYNNRNNTRMNSFDSEEENYDF